MKEEKYTLMQIQRKQKFIMEILEEFSISKAPLYL